MSSETSVLPLIEYKDLVQIKLNSSDFEILNVRESGLGGRIGYAGDHLRIKIDIKRHQPQTNEEIKRKANEISAEFETYSFFAKILPAGGHFRKLVEEMRGFEKEIFFYNVISKDFEPFLTHAKTYPTCFLTKIDRLIIEDMGEYGFEAFQATKEPVGEDHCRQVLSALARLHSASIVKEETSQKSLKQLYSEIMFESIFVTEGGWGDWFNNGLRACEALLPLLPACKKEPSLLSKVKEKFAGLKPAVLKILEPHATARNVICHGDAWVSNVLFHYNKHKPTQAVLVDFQILRYGPPALDVQLFLYMSLAYGKDRTDTMSKMQSFYYACLKEELNRHNIDIDKIIPEEEFKQTCEKSAIFGSILTCMYYHMTQVNSDFMEKVFADQELYEKYILQDRSSEICNFFETDFRFRSTMNSAMEVLIHIILDI